MPGTSQSTPTRKVLFIIALLFTLSALAFSVLLGAQVWDLLFADQFCSVRSRRDRVLVCRTWATHTFDMVLALLGFGFMFLFSVAGALLGSLGVLLLRRKAKVAA
ncbi:hypothetical protein [Chitinimonas sp. BJYL2]|uniref:hypothetical protein n=1 Tax=Chitinimonas sp. BJYL2 TaxID=2976696 RepID=UPI0022B50B8F|nr:hypothetical protein [Chitinimonas sp. BJYL2]